MNTPINVLLFGILLKLLIVALFYTVHTKIDPINLKSLPLDFSNYYVKLSPIVTIRKGYSVVVTQLRKGENILRFIFIPEPYQIPNGKEI